MDEMRVVAFISNTVVEEGVEGVLAVVERDHMEVMGQEVCVYLRLSLCAACAYLI